MVQIESGQHRISVVIPHLNQPDFLQRCLLSLSTGSRKPDEVIVVDNGSSTMPEEICAAYPGTVLLRESKSGPGMARNAGVAVASGNILAFIDADCVADPAWLAIAEATLADPTAVILGGDVRIGCLQPNKPTMTEAYESVYAYRMDRYIAEQGFTGTGNLVVRRTVLEDVGPFAGIAVAEDRDWGHRATAKGYSIRYVASLRVYHPARANLAELCVKWDRHLAHDYKIAIQSKSGRIKWLIKTLAMTPSVLAEIPRILISDRLSGSRARGLAILGLTRIRLYRTRRMASLMVWGNHDSLSGRWNRP